MVQDFDFVIKTDRISLDNRNFYDFLFYESSIPLIAFSIVHCFIFIGLFKFIIFRRPQLFRIFNNQLNSTSFLPFNYLIILHLEKGLLAGKSSDKFLNNKLKFELLNSKQKRTFNFSIPLKYLIFRSPFCFAPFKINRYLYNLIKFFFFFLIDSRHDEICFLVHRKKILEHVQSVHVDLEIEKLDINIYIHGLTIYSFNSNFAYYCSLEDYIHYSTSKSTSAKIFDSKNTITSFNLSNKQEIACKNAKIFCKFFDLFIPNYFNKTHPLYGCPIEYLYLEFNNNLAKYLPKYLSENLAPVNEQTSKQLELLYYINLSNQILMNFIANKPTDHESSELKGSITNNVFNLKEIFIFYLFNLNLLLFTLTIGLNVIIINPKPKLSSVVPVIVCSTLFSLLFTEVIVNLYKRFIKTTSRFMSISILNKIKLKQFLITFIFFMCLSLSTVILFTFSTIMIVFTKQNQYSNPFFTYRPGFVSHFLSDKFYQHIEDVNFMKEISFLLIVYYFSMLIMFRFWTLVISLIRLIFAYLTTLYYDKLLFKTKSKDNQPLVKFYAPNNSKTQSDTSIDPIMPKFGRKKSLKIIKIRKEKEDNLLKYFTKK